jgi:hypothetical protein
MKECKVHGLSPVPGFYGGTTYGALFYITSGLRSLELVVFETRRWGITAWYGMVHRVLNE